MIEYHINLGIWLVMGTLVAYASDSIAEQMLEERGHSVQRDIFGSSMFLQAIFAWPIFVVLMVWDLLAPKKKEKENCECCN
jgi:hypothetical protein